MSTIRVKGQDVRVGDDLWFLGKPYRITRIMDYIHIGVTLGEEWRIAKSDGPKDGGKYAWGMTLSYDHGYAAGYEVTYLPGDERGEPHQPADDYLSPHCGEGARLHPQYLAEGGLAAGTWREWLAARQP